MTNSPAESAASAGAPPAPVHRTAWIVAAVLALIVLLMALVDPIVGPWSIRMAHLPAVDRYRDFSTPLGRDVIHGYFALGLLLAALVCRSKVYARLALVVVVAYVLSGGTCHLLKMTVHRPRPETLPAPWLGGWGLAPCLIENELHSFPSGDVTISAALATIWFLALGSGRPRYAVFLMPLLSAIGRVLGAAHYPSDVLAGGLWGTLWGAWVWRWIMGPRRPSAPAPPNHESPPAGDGHALDGSAATA